MIGRQRKIPTALMLSSLIIWSPWAFWASANVNESANETVNERANKQEIMSSELTSASDKAILFASIEDLQASLQTGELSSVELVDAHLAQIDALDQRGPSLNAIAHRADRAVREQAEQLDAERSSTGPRSLLHGIPLVIKDNYETIGLPTTAGSAAFTQGSEKRAFAPERDAELVRRLRLAGAIVIAKATMHEFAYGITTQGSSFGQARNAYDPARNPGGSSGGTGAAVAAGMATAGMGSDTCGSIRIPAAHNNLVGIRGTQGRHGIVPLSSTQDIGGPLARTVRDLSIMLDATVGFDAQDLQTRLMESRSQPKYHARLEAMDGARIGVLEDWFVQDVADQPVALVVHDALAQLQRDANWTVQTLASPGVNSSLADRPWNGHVVLIRDFANDINQYLAANPELGIDNLAALYGLGVHHPSIAGSLAGSLELEKPEYAQLYESELKQRDRVRAALLDLMEKHSLDALAYPTIRQVAAPLGEDQGGTNCRLSAISGLPAISVPAGFTPEGLPVGVELLGRALDEQTLLNLALTIEQNRGARRQPKFAGGVE